MDALTDGENPGPTIDREIRSRSITAIYDNASAEAVSLAAHFVHPMPFEQMTQSHLITLATDIKSMGMTRSGANESRVLVSDRQRSLIERRLRANGIRPVALDIVLDALEDIGKRARKVDYGLGRCTHCNAPLNHDEHHWYQNQCELCVEATNDLYRSDDDDLVLTVLDDLRALGPELADHPALASGTSGE